MQEIVSLPKWSGDEHLKARIYDWISVHPGVDAWDVAGHFEITTMEAVAITEELLEEGLLEPDEGGR